MTRARPTRARWWWRWLVVVGYMAAIFAASNTPGDQLPPSGLWKHDKLVHAAVFAVLGALAAWAAGPGRSSGRRWLIGFAVAVAYGALDELHQSLVPGRHPDAYDLLADALGGAAGAAALAVFVRDRR